MKVAWSYFWRFGLAAVVGSGAAALLAVGIATDKPAIIVGGIGCLVLLVFIIFSLLVPWLRSWERAI